MLNLPFSNFVYVFFFFFLSLFSFLANFLCCQSIFIFVLYLLICKIQVAGSLVWRPLRACAMIWIRNNVVWFWPGPGKEWPNYDRCLICHWQPYFKVLKIQWFNQIQNSFYLFVKLQSRSGITLWNTLRILYTIPACGRRLNVEAGGIYLGYPPTPRTTNTQKGTQPHHRPTHCQPRSR